MTQNEFDSMILAKGVQVKFTLHARHLNRKSVVVGRLEEINVIT